jgi:hypothetical protein
MPNRLFFIKTEWEDEYNNSLEDSWGHFVTKGLQK